MKLYRIIGRAAALLMVAGGGGLLAAQPPAAAQLNAARGGDITVTSGGQQQQFMAAQLEGRPVSFNFGDAAQTGTRSQMEIMLLPSGPVIKLAENTSIMFNGTSAGRAAPSVTLVYGRVLVRGGKSGAPFLIETGDSAAEIESGDINIDYTVMPYSQPPGTPSLLVTALAGTAAILPRRGTPDFGRIVVRKGESILVDPLLNSVERAKADAAISAYWNQREFKYPAAYEPGIQLNVDNVEPERNGGNPNDMIYILPYKADRVESKVRSAGIVAGLVLMLSGIAVQGAMHFLEVTYFDKKQADTIFYAGFAPIGIGGFVLLASSSYKPRETMPVPAAVR